MLLLGFCYACFGYAQQLEGFGSAALASATLSHQGLRCPSKGCGARA